MSTNRFLPHDPSTLALAAWIGIITAAGILPLRNFSGHPHWESIQWTVRAEDWRSARFYFDVVANVGLFYPFGLLLARRSRITDWLNTCVLGAAGLLLSVGIEGFQVFCHHRRPSVIDVASNTIGTFLGLLTASRVFAWERLNRWLPGCYSHPTGS